MEHDKRPRGSFVAVGYSREAEQVCAALRRRTSRIVKLQAGQGRPGADEEQVQKT
jgi:hypothetical protein